ncbi:MAG TPA: TonB family protein [Gammaproteobacteria bacterium]|nr:TonB family protein [Gammaproteobacteria bacterium]
MSARAPAAILISGALLLLAACASAPRNADLYAADGEAPTDIYRSWQLYNEMQGDGSVEGELRLADLTRWQRDEYRSAYYWYKKAALEGDAVAAANLWYMYETRSEQAADNQQAMSFYQLAAQSDAGQRQLYALETKVAVDSQRRYPQASQQQGATLVEFDRGEDGKAENVKVYRTSGDAALDAAAVEAVQSAELPAVPEGLRDLHHFVISVKPGPQS